MYQMWHDTLNGAKYGLIDMTAIIHTDTVNVTVAVNPDIGLTSLRSGPENHEWYREPKPTRRKDSWAAYELRVKDVGGGGGPWRRTCAITCACGRD